jgi:hypothetical protein
LDILASNALSYKSDDAPIIKMLMIYISKFGNVHWSKIAYNHSLLFLHCLSVYQLEQNNKTNVNFDQDLEVMEQLIEKYGSNGSIYNVFAKTFPIKNHPLLGGWKKFEGSESSKKSSKKDLDSLDESAVADGKEGARLLLLLAYMMVSNVFDDESNNTQM